MPPKQRELTRNQVSSRLAYNASTPAFLQRMQAQVSRQTGRRYGGNDDDDDDDEDAPQVEFESLDADRPAIPVRPRSPKPSRGRRRGEGDDEKEEDDEPEDERPQVVVLKEGKHLSKAEVENEKRKAQGLPPLPINPPDDSSEDRPHITDSQSQPQKERKQPAATMAFSSSSRKDAAANEKRSAAKRRAANIGDDDEGADLPVKKKVKAKAKKPEKKLLSFGDEG